ncbi:MAG: transglycosylase SLT domain-containing protein [bacterium]
MADSVKSKELRLVLREILLSELADNENIKEAKILFKEYENDFEQAVKRSISFSNDTLFISHFRRLGYKIESKTYDRKRVNTNSLRSMIEFINKHPNDDYSRKLYSKAKDFMSKEETIEFLLANMKGKENEKYFDSLSPFPEVRFMAAVVTGDTVKIKSLINYNLNLFIRTEKKYKIKYSIFVSDSLRNKSLEYYLGRSYEDSGELEKALKSYIKAEDEEAVLRITALLKNNSKVSQLSDSILLNYPGLSAPFMYHKAKLLLQMKKTEEGEEILQRLSREFPKNLYAIRSFLYLNKTFAVEEIKDSFDSDILELYGSFKNTGREEYFSKFIFRITASEKISRRDAALLTDSLKIHNLAIYFAENLPASDVSLNFIEVMYPVPYIELFRRASKKYNVELPLLLAMAREESSFNPSAVSSAGAKGIMQLMDFTYSEYYKDNDFFDIEKNIDAGAHHLSVYMKDFPNNPAEGIMSYNAGKGNVKKWKRVYADWELHLESVPFIETKNYVKRVLRSYYVYKFIIKVS